MAIRLLSSEIINGDVTISKTSAVNLRVTDGTQNVYVGSSGNVRFGLGAGASIIQSTGASFGIGTQDGNNFVLGANNTAVLTLDTSGNATFAGNVGVAGKTPAYGLSLAQGTGVNNKIVWTDATPSFRASMWADSSDDKFKIATGNASSVETVALEIDTSQNVGINASSYLGFNGAGDASHSVGYNAGIDGAILRGQNGVILGTGGGATAAERMRIESDGKIQVGSDKVIWAGGYGGGLVIRQNNATGDRLIKMVTVDSTGSIAIDNVLVAKGSSVGIGTDSPSAKLDVDGDNTGKIRLSRNGSTRVELSNNANEGELSLYRSSTAKTIYISSYYDSYFNGGNVGIGTTTPRAVGSGYKGLEVSSPSSGSSLWLSGFSDTTKGYLAMDTGGLNLTAISNHSLTFGTNNSPKMTILSGGNVLIGITSSSAGGKFTVRADSSTTSFGGNPVMILENLSATDGQVTSIGFRNNNSIGTTSYIDSVAVDHSIGATDLRFSTYSGSAWNDNLLVLSNTGNVGIGTTSPETKLEVRGSIASGTGTAPTQLTYDTSGLIRAFVHNFNEEKNTPSARNVTFVNVSGLGNFHQSFFYVQYGTRLQGVSDSTTGVVIRTYGVNRFNGGTLQVTETNAIAGSSNSLTHALVTVQIVSNTEYRLRIEFSSTLGASSFVTGLINGFAVGDSFPTITFAEGTAGM